MSTNKRLCDFRNKAGHRISVIKLNNSPLIQLQSGAAKPSVLLDVEGAEKLIEALEDFIDIVEGTNSNE